RSGTIPSYAPHRLAIIIPYALSRSPGAAAEGQAEPIADVTRRGRGTLLLLVDRVPAEQRQHQAFGRDRDEACCRLSSIHAIDPFYCWRHSSYVANISQ